MRRGRFSERPFIPACAAIDRNRGRVRGLQQSQWPPPQIPPRETLCRRHLPGKSEVPAHRRAPLLSHRRCDSRSAGLGHRRPTGAAGRAGHCRSRTAPHEIGHRFFFRLCGNRRTGPPPRAGSYISGQQRRHPLVRAELSRTDQRFRRRDGDFRPVCRRRNAAWTGRVCHAIGRFRYRHRSARPPPWPGSPRPSCVRSRATCRRW